MPPLKSASLDKWRDYFRTSNSDIFDIIEQAIMVAASDCPKEFRIRRDRIAETLFSCKLIKCFGCDQVELALPGGDEDEGCKSEFDRDGCEFEVGASKGSKMNSSGKDHGKINVNQVSNYSYGEAEALTDELEEESQIFGEVLRIKEIVDNSQDESDSVLYDSLRKLQLMALSVETLKATEIGKSINSLRKHASKDIRLLARTVIEGWKDMVDEWVNATAAITVSEATPESVNPSVLDEEEGLPSPPLDDLAFFATQGTSMELSQFFDGMDDDGNPGNSGEFKKHENGRKPPVKNNSIPKLQQQQQQLPNAPTKGDQKKKHECLIKKQSTASKPNNKPPIAESGPGRPTKLNMEQKVHNGTGVQPQKSEKVGILRRPPTSQQDKSRCSDDAAVQVKLEVTKRKLQERYRQAENAKRQRTIQVMELRDLPKQSLVHKTPHMRPGSGNNNHNRHWANGHR